MELWVLVESKAKEIVEPLRIMQTQTGELKREVGWKFFLLHVFHYISVTSIQCYWLKPMKNLLQLTGTKFNTFIPVPVPLLCVSLILNAATTNPPPSLGKTRFVNINFTIVDTEGMAKSHQFYYSDMFNIFCMIVINHSHQVQ